MRILIIFIAIVIYMLSCQTKSPSEKPNPVLAGEEKNVQILFADTLSDNWIVLKSTVYNKPAFLLIDNGTIPQQQLILFKDYSTTKGIIDSMEPFAEEMKRIEKLPAPVSIYGFSDTLSTEIHSIYFAPTHKMPDGILGKGFLAKYILTVDYYAKTLQIVDSAGFIVPESFDTIELKPAGAFYKFGAKLFIRGKTYIEDLYLDLGNSHDGFLFGLNFYQKNKGKLNIDASPSKESFSQFSKSKVATILVDSVVINGNVIRNIPSDIVTQSSTSYIPLLVGNSVLRNFGKVIFDLGHNKIYFRKLK